MAWGTQVILGLRDPTVWGTEVTLELGVPMVGGTKAILRLGDGGHPGLCEPHGMGHRAHSGAPLAFPLSPPNAALGTRGWEVAPSHLTPTSKLLGPLSRLWEFGNISATSGVGLSPLASGRSYRPTHPPEPHLSSPSPLLPLHPSPPPPLLPVGPSACPTTAARSLLASTTSASPLPVSLFPFYFKFLLHSF